MRMSLNQSRHQCSAGHLDYLSAGWDLNVAGRARGLDAVPAHQHGPAIMYSRRLSVEQPSRFEQIDIRRLCCCWPTLRVISGWTTNEQTTDRSQEKQVSHVATFQDSPGL